MRDGFSIFDAHCHIGEALHSGRVQRTDMMLDRMDRHGIDRALAIPFPMVRSFRDAHDEIGAALRAHPARFVGAACMDPFIGETEFRQEVRRCREEYGFRALKFQPQFQPVDPSSPGAEFLFETALENQLALVCHTGSGVPYALPSAFMPAARKYPELKIVLAHSGGGGLLFQDAVVAALFCPNIYLELSTLMPNHVLRVLSQVTSARLMIGSDLPENIGVEIGKILDLEVPEEARRDMLWGTAHRVFDEDC
jgi:predicted TIM-barrel fold metal-dependent hydrolase